MNMLIIEFHSISFSWLVITTAYGRRRWRCAHTRDSRKIIMLQNQRVRWLALLLFVRFCRNASEMVTFLCSTFIFILKYSVHCYIWNSVFLALQLFEWIKFAASMNHFELSKAINESNVFLQVEKCLRLLRSKPELYFCVGH